MFQLLFVILSTSGRSHANKTYLKGLPQTKKISPDYVDVFDDQY